MMLLHILYANITAVDHPEKKYELIQQNKKNISSFCHIAITMILTAFIKGCFHIQSISTYKFQRHGEFYNISFCACIFFVSLLTFSPMALYAKAIETKNSTYFK